MALVPTQPPIQGIPGALSLGVKRSGRETDHWPPSSAEVKEWVELYLHSPSTPPWRGAQLKHRDNFTFTISEHISLFHQFGISKRSWELSNEYNFKKLVVESWTGPNMKASMNIMKLRVPQEQVVVWSRLTVLQT
jgi:hypothetical protein